MSMSTLRTLIGTLALATCCAWAQSPPPPPAEAFFAEPEFTGAALSPSAKHLAVRFAPRGERQLLAVVDLADFSVKIVASFNNLDVNRFHWVNDERLVFDSKDTHTAQGNATRASGMWSVKRDGTQSRQLVATYGASFFRTSKPGMAQPWNTFFLHGGFPQDSEQIYVGRYTVRNYLVDTVELMRLNTATGQARPVPGPKDARYWTFDAKGEPRLVMRQDGPRESLHYRAGDADGWREILSYDRVARTVHSADFSPDGALYVSSSNGKDKSALYKMDVATGQLEAAPLVAVDGFDFDGDLIGSDRLLGVLYRDEFISTRWFDDRMKAIQARVDKALPATVNMISLARRATTPWMLVSSQSSGTPPAFYAFNSETGVLQFIGSMFPQIDPAQMARTELVRYKARDGLEIPAWLTVPRNGTGKDLPMVVIVHDGPNTRGRSLAWSAEAQFLASRGYAVLEPEYRGSTGFGAFHFQAGWKQWGLKMQDDLADGARWAVSQGIANAGRMCIMGRGYGGYAALMGVAKDPDLFKCAVSEGGITDIRRLYSGHWSQASATSDDAKRYSMPQLIGDPEKDAVQLKVTSPIEWADRIERPMLLAHGEANLLVPVYHSRKFRDAAARANKNVEYIEYPGETHDMTLAKTRIDFWQRVEAFLYRNVGR